MFKDNNNNEREREREREFKVRFSLCKMLTSALRALVKNPIKENFYGKKKY